MHHTALADLSPELRLALACARVVPSAQGQATIEALLPRIDVTEFLSLVRRHRIGPMVHNALVVHSPAVNMVPSTLRDALTAETHANKLRAMHATRSNLLLARRLAEAGISWLPLKGVTLAAESYGDYTLRHANDLDGWIPEDQLGAAREVLMAAGYQDDDEENNYRLIGRGPRHADFVRWRNYHDVYTGPDGLCLELHWRLTDNPHGLRIDHEAALARSGAVTLAGATFRVLDPVDQLLYLCEHGGKHCWFRLKWLFDLPQLLEAHDWDWPAVLRRARMANCLITLTLGLLLAEALFRWRMPEQLRQSLRPRAAMALRIRIVVYALQTPADWWLPGSYGPVWWQTVFRFFRIGLMNGVRSLAYEGKRSCLSLYDLRSHPLPDRWFAAYWLLRPYNLMRRKWYEASLGRRAARA